MPPERLIEPLHQKHGEPLSEVVGVVHPPFEYSMFAQYIQSRFHLPGSREVRGIFLMRAFGIVMAGAYRAGWDKQNVPFVKLDHFSFYLVYNLPACNEDQYMMIHGLVADLPFLDAIVVQDGFQGKHEQPSSPFPTPFYAHVQCPFSSESFRKRVESFKKNR
jgi:hypothetical protein